MKKRSDRRLRHRVMVDGAYVFGPGKADVLAGIAEMGSLSAAARSIGMSYMRAWKLLQSMQETFTAPLVELQRGGKAQGAKLTPTGEKALALYRQMEEEALAATGKTWKKFCGIVRRK
jgi:molybdate transport system regulatory protein